MALPIRVCDEIDKKCRLFVWGGGDQQRKIHTLSWGELCEPKKTGALGLKSTHVMNKAFLMKAGWRLNIRKKALWSDLIRSKYKCGKEGRLHVDKDKHGSNFWRGLCKNWDMLETNLSWRVGNGQQIRFWIDEWVPSQGKLIDLAMHQVDEGMKKARVAEFINQHGMWDMDKLRFWLPSDVCDRIRAIIPPSNLNPNDAMSWKGSSDGSFSVSSAYKFAAASTSCVDSVFEVIWRWKGPERIRLHLWKVAKDAFLTNDLRYKRGISMDGMCTLCNTANEDTLHVMRDYPIAHSVWNCVSRGNVAQNFYILHLRDC